MTRYEIRFGDWDESSPEHILTLENFSDLSFNDNHSTASDWSMVVPTSGINWQENLLERVYVWDNEQPTTDESIIYIGLFEKYDNNKRNDGTFKLSGRGVLAEDLSVSVGKTYTKQFTHEIIQQFGSNEVSFNHNISVPSHYSELEKIDVTLADLEPTYADIVQETGNGVGPSFTAVTYDWTEEQFDGRRVSGDVIRQEQMDTYSADSALRFGANNTGTHSYSFEVSEFEHSLGTDWEIPLFLQSVDSFPADVRIYQDGTQIRSKSVSSGGWHKPVSNWNVDNSISTVDSGTTTFEIEVNTSSSSQSLDVDVAAVVDTNYSHSYPTTLNGNGFYDGPEMFPESVDVEFKQEGTKLDTGAELIYNVNDVSKTDIQFTDFEANIFDDLQITTSKTDWVQFTNQQPAPTTENNYTIHLKRDSRHPQQRSGRYFMQALEYAVLIPFRDAGVSFNVQQEYDGEVLNVFGKIHSDSAWRFNTDFGETVSVNSFIRGEQRNVPASFKLESESLKTDVADYANQVTIIGKDGLEATRRSESEIAKFGKTVEKTFRDTTLTTQSDVESFAKTKLNETIRERDESGQLTSPPTLFDVGYSYIFDNFQSSLSSGEQVGNGQTIHDNTQVNYIKSFDGDLNTFDVDAGQFDSDSGFEILVQPDLDGIGNNEYYSLVSSYFSHDFLRVYGDGSIGIRNPAEGANDNTIRSNAGLLDGTMQRITVITYEESDSWTGNLWVEGGDAASPDMTFPATERMVPATFYVGVTFPQTRIHRGKLKHHWKADGEDFNSNGSGKARDSYGKDNPIGDGSFIEQDTLDGTAPSLPSDKDVSGNISTVQKMSWADNGNRLYVHESSSGYVYKIHQYSASKPYEIQTVTHEKSVNIENKTNIPNGTIGTAEFLVWENSYGKWVFLDEEICEITSGWDITSLSYVETWYIIDGLQSAGEDIEVGPNKDYVWQTGDSGRIALGQLPDENFTSGGGSLSGGEYDFSLVSEYQLDHVDSADSHVIASQWLTDDMSDTRLMVVKETDSDDTTPIVQIVEINCNSKTDIGNATSDTLIEETSLTGRALPKGLAFKPDGSRVYIPTDNLKIADIWTRSFSVEQSSETETYNFGTDFTDIQYDENGTTLYASDKMDNVLQFSLSTAYDADTASYQKYLHMNDGTVGDNGGNPVIDIVNDGQTLYTLDRETNNSESSVQQYTLSTPFDVGTAALDYVETYDVPSYDTIADMTVSVGGDRVFFLIQGDDNFEPLKQFNLSTPFEISGEIEGSSPDKEFGPDSAPSISETDNLEFDTTGKRMFIKQDATVQEFSLGTAYEIDTTNNQYVSEYDTLGTIGSYTETLTITDRTQQFVVEDAGEIYRFSMPKGSMDLTINNGVTLTETGRWRFAAQFDATNGGLTAAPDFGKVADGSEFSLSMWIRTRDSSQTILGAGADGSEGYRLYIDSNEDVVFEWNDGAGNSDTISTSGITISDDDWYHLTVSLLADGTSRIDVDGVTETSNAGPNPETIKPSELWALGVNPASTESSFTGRMDDIRWFASDALTLSEVGEIANFRLVDTVYGGAIDDIRVWDADFSDDMNVQKLLDNTKSNANDIQWLDGSLILYWQLEKEVIGEEYDIDDTSGYKRTVNGVLSNLDVEVADSSLEEVGYNLSMGGGEVSLKFDISDRIDVVLNNTKKELESIKDSV